jgi:hypothetical protein
MIYDCLLFYTNKHNIDLRLCKVPGLLTGDRSVEAQGIEGWFSGVGVVFGYGADGVLLAVGDRV